MPSLISIPAKYLLLASENLVLSSRSLLKPFIFSGLHSRQPARLFLGRFLLWFAIELFSNQADLSTSHVHYNPSQAGSKNLLGIFKIIYIRSVGNGCVVSGAYQGNGAGSRRRQACVPNGSCRELSGDVYGNERKGTPDIRNNTFQSCCHFVGGHMKQKAYAVDFIVKHTVCCNKESTPVFLKIINGNLHLRSNYQLMCFIIQG